MNQKEKTIRDLDPRDIKLSTIAKFFGGVWTILVGLGFIWGTLLFIGGGVELISGNSSADIVIVLGGIGAAIAFAELKYKFIKPAIQKIFS